MDDRRHRKLAQKQGFFVQKPGRRHGIRQPVHGKDIDPQRLHVFLRVVLLADPGAAVHDLHIGGIQRSLFKTAQFQMPGEQLSSPVQPDQLFVVRPGHADIDVVVPGDESFVAHRAQERSGAHGVCEPVLSADSVKRQKDLQLCLLNLIQCQFFHSFLFTVWPFPPMSRLYGSISLFSRVHRPRSFCRPGTGLRRRRPSGSSCTSSRS